jgi:hypothetical protein
MSRAEAQANERDMTHIPGAKQLAKKGWEKTSVHLSGTSWLHGKHRNHVIDLERNVTVVSTIRCERCP